MMFNLKILSVGAGLAGLMGASSVCELCSESRAERAAITASAFAVDTSAVKLAIKGMTCGGCATAARVALQRVEGVYRAEVSFETASAVVLYDPDKTTPEALIAHLKKLTGFDARVVSENEKSSPKERG